MRPTPYKKHTGHIIVRLEQQVVIDIASGDKLEYTDRPT